MQLIGFLDDDPQKINSHNDVLGQILAARRIVEEKHIDDLVIALPRRAYNHVNALVESLQDLPVRVWIVPDYFELALHQARLAEFAGLPMLDLNAAALSEYQRMIKRVFDLLVIGLFVIPAFLVMVVVALAIFIFDGRPILFKQSRAGESGRLFTLLNSAPWSLARKKCSSRMRKPTCMATSCTSSRVNPACHPPWVFPAPF